jgi:hypothetical protein
VGSVLTVMPSSSASAALMIDWMMQASPVLVVVSVPASSQAPKKRPSETSWALTPVTAHGAERGSDQ